MKKYLIFLFLSCVLLAACAIEQSPAEKESSEFPSPGEANPAAISSIVPDTPTLPTNEVASGDATPAALGWKGLSLADVSSAEVFAISDFFGKPVLVESFAVWCSTCLRQQKELNKLHEIAGDSIITISLNTDPNEDARVVQEHVQRHNLKGYYAIASLEFIRDLVDYFGNAVLSAPQAPIILVCENQMTRFLDPGLKSAETLLEEVERGCDLTHDL